MYVINKFEIYQFMTEFQNQSSLQSDSIKLTTVLLSLDFIESVVFDLADLIN